jgi:hypothetical protein
VAIMVVRLQLAVFVRANRVTDPLSSVKTGARRAASGNELETLCGTNTSYRIGFTRGTHHCFYLSDKDFGADEWMRMVCIETSNVSNFCRHAGAWSGAQDASDRATLRILDVAGLF